MDKLLEIQQAKGLANLKYMVWKTGVDEEKLTVVFSISPGVDNNQLPARFFVERSVILLEYRAF